MRTSSSRHLTLLLLCSLTSLGVLLPLAQDASAQQSSGTTTPSGQGADDATAPDAAAEALETPEEVESEEDLAEDDTAPEEGEVLQESEGDEELVEGEEDEEILLDEGDEEQPPIEFVTLDVWSSLPLDLELIGKNERDRRDTAGSAHTLSPAQIDRISPRSTAELLEYLPNVSLTNTDPMGLRLNLGMRGFPSNRSTYTLILEDGVAIAAAPYLRNAILYTTPVEKIARVEQLTGSSSILYGPQNMGGAINLVTLAPPRSFTTSAYFEGGAFGRLNLGTSIGDTKGVVGYLLEAHHRRFEGPQDLDLVSTDLSAKFRLQPSERSWFGAKLSIYDEFSRASRTGLTQRIYDRAPNTVVAPYDRNELDRLAASIQHTYLVNDFGLLQTTLWANTMTRHVQQQRFERVQRPLTDYERIILGSGTTPTDGMSGPDDGSLYFLDSTEIEKERYSTLGVESRLTLDIELGKVARSELILGLRGSQEDIDREVQRGQHGGSPSGTTTLDEERTGDTLASYALGRFFFFKEKLRVEPGVRLEFLRSERRVWRAALDGEPTDFNPPREGGDTSTSLLPGVGTSLDLGDHVTLFGSAHRSMAIPEERLASTLIDPESVNLVPEFAWNFELGTRLYDRELLSLDLSGFYIQTRNITLPITSFTTTNANSFEFGETRHMGAEASLNADPSRYFRSILRFPILLNYSYTHATLTDGWRAPLIGNFVPYVPRHRANFILGAEHPLGIGAHVAARYTSESFSEIENFASPEASGIRGTIPARTSIDARLAYTHIPWNTTFYMLGKNLLDQRTISTRTNQGIFVTGAREFIAGAQASF